MDDIKYFKTAQFVSLKDELTLDVPWESFGYICHGYKYEGDEIYLVSGEANIKHNITDLKENYYNHIIQLINSIENGKN